jgi:hypothetical protein
MMIKFAQAVERAKNDTLNPISEESALMLLESNLSPRLLADRTLGDSNRITASTPYEVLEELKNSLVRKEKAQTDEVKQSLEVERTEKEKVADELNNQTTNLTNIIETASVRGRKIAVGVLIVAALVFYAFAEFYEPKPIFIKIISYIISVGSIISSIGIFAFGEKVENYIRVKLARLLLKK